MAVAAAVFIAFYIEVQSRIGIRIETALDRIVGIELHALAERVAGRAPPSREGLLDVFTEHDQRHHEKSNQHDILDRCLRLPSFGCPFEHLLRPSFYL